MSRPSLLLILCAALASAALAQAPAVKKVPPPYTLPTDGARVYAAYCASCHGLKGLGDGPVAASLKIPTPDLSTLARRNQGQFPSSRVADSIKGETGMQAHGSADMPVWGPVFRNMDGRSEGATKVRVHNLVRYIESLQAK